MLLQVNNISIWVNMQDWLLVGNTLLNFFFLLQRALWRIEICSFGMINSNTRLIVIVSWWLWLGFLSTQLLMLFLRNPTRKLGDLGLNRPGSGWREGWDSGESAGGFALSVTNVRVWVGGFAFCVARVYCPLHAEFHTREIFSLHVVLCRLSKVKVIVCRLFAIIWSLFESLFNSS